MGIFGAMTTAVSGLRAQAYSLENISGNIANSQTTGFKRVETSFVDLLPDMPYRRELAGSVSAFSRLTNTIQGDLQSTGVSTHMAVNGEGFFIVQERTGYQNNVPTFGGVDLYTRRGDFTLDKDGFLVNGAGLYLRGTSIDPITGDTLNTGNGVVRVSSEPLGARQTTQIVYRANLPTRPGTTSAVAEVAGSELLAAPATAPLPPAPAFPAGYDPRITAVPAPAGSGVVVGSDVNRFMAQSIEGGLVPAYNAVGARIDIQMRWAKVLGSAEAATTTAGDISGGIPLGGGGGNLVINGTTVALDDGDTSAEVLTKINAQTGATNVTASLNASNQLVLTHGNQGGGGSLLINGTAVALADGDSSSTILSKINAQTGTTNVTASLDASNQLVLTHGNQGGGGNLIINGTTISLVDGDNSAALLSKINAQTGATNVTASLDGSNQLVLTHSNQGGGGNLVINGTTIALADGDSSAAILTKINAQTGVTNVTASLDGGNQLVLTHSNPALDVVIDAASTGVTLTELGLAAGTTTGATTGTQDVSTGLTTAGDVIIDAASTGATLTDLGLAAGTTAASTTGSQDVSAGVSAAGNVVIGASSTGVTLTELGLTAGSTSAAAAGTQNVSTGLTTAGNIVIGATSTGVTLTELGLAAGSTAAVATGSSSVGAGLTAGDAGNIVINGTTITLAEGDASTAILNKINAATSTTGVVATLSGGNLVLTANNITGDIDIGAGSSAPTLAAVGLSAGTTPPTPTAGETWNLFYLTNSRAANNIPAWENVGVPFVFNTSGQMVPLAGDVVVNGLTVDGNNVGDISFDFGNGGLTQYASADGRVQQSTLQQDGYSSGVLDSVSVTSDGRISGSYTNGRVVTVAAISIAQFNADNALKRRDGGVYEQTLESGLPIIGLNGATIIGGNIEGSNTDIAEEFSKMIVTQQAYSANTRVVSTSQQMLSDVLNMVR